MKAGKRKAGAREAPSVEQFSSLVMAEVQTGENRRAFFPNGVESVRIQAQKFQDRGSHLSGFHKTMNGAALMDAGTRNQKHDVGVIPSLAAMLGLFL